MENKIKNIIAYIDFQQSVYINMAKKDKKIKKEVDAIITATSLIKMKAESLLKEKNETAKHNSIH